MKNKLTFILIFLSVILFGNGSLVANSDMKITVSVLEFKVQGNIPLKDAGKIVSEQIESNLVKTGNFLVTERALLNKILEEQKLSAVGMVDDKTAVRLGKLCGAQKIITGTVSGISGKYYISAKIIDTTTGEIEKVVSTEFKNIRNLPDESSYIVRLLFKDKNNGKEQVKGNLINENDLVAFWPMREGNGSIINDKSGNGIQCMGENISWDGDNGVIFNGINSYVDCDNNKLFDFENGITVILYFKYDKVNRNFASLIEKTGSFTVAIKKNGYLEFFINGVDSVSTNRKLVPNRWYMVAAEFDGEKIKLFLNGMLKKQFSRKGKIRNVSSPLVIGDWSDKDGYRAFSGEISNVKLYRAALNNDEIVSEYKKFITEH